MITVIVADDQELVREGIAAILEAEADIEVVGSAADGAEALGLVHAVRPDVALMDIRMPKSTGSKPPADSSRAAPPHGC